MRGQKPEVLEERDVYKYLLRPAAFSCQQREAHEATLRNLQKFATFMSVRVKSSTVYVALPVFPRSSCPSSILKGKMR